MKTRKFLLFILAIALISSLLVIVPSADSGKVVISEDYNTVTYNGNEYVYFSETFSAAVTKNLYFASDFALTDEQKKEIDVISASIFGDAFIGLEISFSKGGYLDDYYINVDLIDDYERLLAEGGSDYYFHDSANYEFVHIDKKQLFNSPVSVKIYETYYYELFSSVYTISSDGYFEIFSGDILRDNDGNYYYYDQLAEPDGDRVTLWKLDKSIFEDENPPDTSFEGDGFMIGFSAVVLSLFFGAIPLAALIVCLILSFKAKQPYRRGLLITAILCAIEIVTFIVTMIILLI